MVQHEEQQVYNIANKDYDHLRKRSNKTPNPIIPEAEQPIIFINHYEINRRIGLIDACLKESRLMGYQDNTTEQLEEYSTIINSLLSESTTVGASEESTF